MGELLTVSFKPSRFGWRYLDEFCVTVNYQDPRWSQIRKQDYSYCSPKLRLKDFPIDGEGEVVVRCGWLHFNDETSIEEYAEVLKNLKLKSPNRAVSETVLDMLGEEERTNNPSLCVCGIRRVDTQGNACVGALFAGRFGRHMERHFLDSEWHPKIRWLVVLPYD